MSRALAEQINQMQLSDSLAKKSNFIVTSHTLRLVEVGAFQSF